MGGIKYDNGKPKIALVPPELVLAVAQALTHGAEKYSDRNWEKGLAWSRVYSSLQRHVQDFWAGVETDPDSGMPNLWCAGACIAFLITYEQRRIGLDDRQVETWLDEEDRGKNLWDVMKNRLKEPKCSP